MFVGRKDEIQTLQSLFSLPRAQLIAITGRRRIGKNTLIEEFGKKAHFFIKLQGLAPSEKIEKSHQLENFSEQLAKYNDDVKLEIKSWAQAFRALKSLARTKRTVILLDEISWMGDGSPEFLGQLKIAWDDSFKNCPQLLLILCGSVSSWIDDNILNGANFVGRISHHIHLKEFSLEEIGEFWKKTPFCSTDKIKLANITGGFPKYLEIINPKISVHANIKNLCFKRGGFFVEEFDKVFNDTFDKRATIYRKILLALVNQKLNFTEICQKLKMEKKQSSAFIAFVTTMYGFI